MRGITAAYPVFQYRIETVTTIRCEYCRAVSVSVKGTTIDYIQPTKGQIEPFQKAFAPAEKVTMLNLLKFRNYADYSKLPDEPPCCGAEAFSRYEQHIAPTIISLGGRIVFSAIAKSTVIGPSTEQWDRVILVEYPSANTMGEMLASKQYQSIAHHRTAAVEDSRLIATSVNS